MIILSQIWSYYCEKNGLCQAALVGAGSPPPPMGKSTRNRVDLCSRAAAAAGGRTACKQQQQPLGPEPLPAAAPTGAAAAMAALSPAIAAAACVLAQAAAEAAAARQHQGRRAHWVGVGRGCQLASSSHRCAAASARTRLALLNARCLALLGRLPGVPCQCRRQRPHQVVPRVRLQRRRGTCHQPGRGTAIG